LPVSRRTDNSSSTLRPETFALPTADPVNMPHDHDDPRYPVHKTDAEWRAELDPTQYQVARKAATERPFTGKYWNHVEAGSYLCVGCGTPLFESGTKFDAGCGWPSYWAAINSEVVECVRDTSHGMVRVEVRCNHCGSHLGHVFDDGPEPTGERFCINSASIDFKPGSGA
jgi:peptide-methionine (R)-S-oxide reductase